MAESLLVGAAVEAVFGELLRAILEVKDKAVRFKPMLAYLQTTLTAIEPVIKEIELHNNQLGRRKEELEHLIKQMEQGTRLVHECAKIRRFNLRSRIRHQEQLAVLMEMLVRFFMIDMNAQTARDVKETLIKVTRIHSAVTKRSYQSTSDQHTGASSSEVCHHHPVLPMVDTNGENSLESTQQVPINSPSHKTEAKTKHSPAAEHTMRNDLLHSDKKRFIGNRFPKITSILHKRSEFKTQLGKGPSEPLSLYCIDGCPHNFDVEVLLPASAEKLGNTSYGNTYKVILKHETTLVVKRLRYVVLKKEEFERKIEIAQRVSQHTNVLQLLASYYSPDEKLLIYKYMEGGSLSDLLHGKRNKSGWTPTDWDTRMKIALGVAKGIAHIHSVQGGTYFHGNISSSNVLVTPDGQGIISDLYITCSLSKSFNLFRNKGYHAEEVIKTKIPTQKSDVYSFGILLLEMLTGVLASESDDDLPNWVQLHTMDGLLYAVLDGAILDKKRAMRMLALALACAGIESSYRPSMAEVVSEMEEIMRAS